MLHVRSVVVISKACVHRCKLLSTLVLNLKCVGFAYEADTAYEPSLVHRMFNFKSHARTRAMYSSLINKIVTPETKQ